MTVGNYLPRGPETLDCPATAPGVLKRGSKLYGKKAFLVDPARRLSFEEAEAEAARRARGFLALGLGKGVRIGLMMSNSIDWVLNWFAAARMGGVVVCLSTFYQPREIYWALRHNDIDTLIVEAHQFGHDYLQRLETSIPGLAEQTEPTLFLKHVPHLRRIIVWGDCNRPWATCGQKALEKALADRPVLDDEFLNSLEQQVTPADDLTIICTSGTTAEPKAALHTHGGAIRNTWAFTPVFGCSSEDCIYNAMPMFWVGGFLLALMPALYEGATLAFSTSLSPSDIVDVLESERVTIFNLTGGVAPSVMREALRRGLDLSRIRGGGGPPKDKSGVPIPPDAGIGSQLGMTETFGSHSGEAFWLPAPPGKQGNWGRPMPGIERRIVHPETRIVLGPGQEGELEVRGPTLMRGYYKRERSAVFTADGFFATGDRCVIDDDGYLYFRGRLTEMIKTSGANVAPREVEAVLNAMPEIRESIVFGIPDRRRGEAIVAILILVDGARIDEADIRDRVRSQISNYKAPRIVITVDPDEVPRTDTGKVKKNVLRDLLLADGRLEG